MGVCALGCTRLRSPDADAGVGERPSELLRRLAPLNECAAAENCWDFGFVPGIGCHVPVTARHTSEAADIVDAAPAVLAARESCAFERSDAAAPRCRIECPSFFGYECRAGKCTPRAEKPDRDVCFVNEAPRDCGYVLKQLAHSPSFDCRAVCDGGHMNGARVQVIADGVTGDGKGYAERLVIDFVRCSACPK